MARSCHFTFVPGLSQLSVPGEIQVWLWKLGAEGLYVYLWALRSLNATFA